MNSTIHTLLSHRSIRRYEEKPVEEEILEQIVEAVQAAPNWVNLQHVSIIMIKDKEKREQFSRMCGDQKQITQATVFLVFCADFFRTWLACQKYGQGIEDVVNQIDNLIVGANEVGIALGTAVAAAESFDLGTVPIGDIRLRAMEAVRELALPRYVVPMLGLCIGYPAEDPGCKRRLPKEAVCLLSVLRKYRFPENFPGSYRRDGTRYALIAGFAEVVKPLRIRSDGRLWRKLDLR